MIVVGFLTRGVGAGWGEATTDVGKRMEVARFAGNKEMATGFESYSYLFDNFLGGMEVVKDRTTISDVIFCFEFEDFGVGE